MSYQNESSIQDRLKLAIDSWITMNLEMDISVEYNMGKKVM